MAHPCKDEFKIKKPYNVWIDMLLTEPIVTVDRGFDGIYLSRRAKNDLKGRIAVKSIWHNRFALRELGLKPRRLYEQKDYVWYKFDHEL